MNTILFKHKPLYGPFSLACLLSLAFMLAQFDNALRYLVNSWWGKALLLCGALALVIVESQGRNDWDIFLSAANDLFDQENIYSNLYYGSYHYYYSVLFASALKLFAWLPVQLSKAFWLMLNMVLLYRIGQLVYCYLGQYLNGNKLRYVFGLLLLVASFRFVRGNLHLGQLTIVMLCFSLEGMYRIQKGQWFAGALFISIAINIKLLPLVLLPYLLYKAQWKAFASVIILLVVFALLPAIWLGWQQNAFLLQEWWLLVNPTKMAHIKDIEEPSFHNLGALLSTLLTDYVNAEQGLQTRHNIANLSQAQLFWVVQFARLFFVLLTLYFLNALPFRPMQSKSQTWWEVSYIMLIVPLIFPHQQHYAFLMTLPALAYMLSFFLNQIGSSRNARNPFMLGVFVLIVVTYNFTLFVPSISAWFNHYKVITYSTFLLVMLLAMARPKDLQPKTAELRF